MRKIADAGLTVLLALSPCALVFGQGAPRNITVLANYTFHGRHSPFFVALDKGFFEQAGFKVDIQPATGSGFVISAIESGKADYGLADASTTVQASATLIVLDGDYQKSGWVYAVRTEDGRKGWIPERGLRLKR